MSASPARLPTLSLLIAVLVAVVAGYFPAWRMSQSIPGRAVARIDESSRRRSFQIAAGEYEESRPVRAGRVYALDPSAKRLSGAIGRLLVPKLMAKYQTEDERPLNQRVLSKIFESDGFNAKTSWYDFVSTILFRLRWPAYSLQLPFFTEPAASPTRR
ncbi:MAG: hypothetical protein ACRD4P_15480 [Bryobacteraceae bacterium]